MDMDPLWYGIMLFLPVLLFSFSFSFSSYRCWYVSVMQVYSHWLAYLAIGLGIVSVVTPISQIFFISHVNFPINNQLLVGLQYTQIFDTTIPFVSSDFLGKNNPLLVLYSIFHTRMNTVQQVSFMMLKPIIQKSFFITFTA